MNQKVLDKSTATMQPANEGVLGAAGGVAATFGAAALPVPGALLGLNAGARAHLTQMRRKVDLAAKGLYDGTLASAKAAFKAGKISEKELKEIQGKSLDGVIMSAIGGAVPLYNLYSIAKKGSELEDLHKELKELLSEYKKEYKEAEKKASKPANESIEIGGFDFGKPKSKGARAALEELADPETPADTAPVEGEGGGEVQATDGGAGADGAPADDTPPADGADAGGDPAAAAGDDVAPPAGDEPAVDGTEPSPVDATPVEGTEVPPPATGDDGNAEVDALPEAPPLNADAPADGGDAATPPSDGTPDPEVDAVTPTTDETAIGQEIEANVGEMNEIEVNTAETEGEIDQVNVAIEHLTDMSRICRRSLERGGLNRDAVANMIGRAALLTDALGQPRLMTAGLESADTPSDRIDQTNQVAGQVDGLASRLKQTVREGAGKIIAWAKQIYAVLTEAALRVEKRALALKSKAATSGQAVQVTDQVVIAGVTLGDSIPTDMTRAVGELVKTLQFLNASASYAKLEEAMDIVQQMANDPSKKSALDARLAAAIAGYSNKMISATAGVLVGGSNGVSKSKLFGEKELTTTIPTEASRLGETKSTLVEAKAANVPQSINGVAPQVATRVCDAVAAAARQLREFNKSGATHRLTERAASVLKSAQDMPESEVSAAVLGYAQAVATAASQAPAFAYNRSMIASLNAVLDFVAASAGAPTPADGGLPAGAPAATPAV